MELFMLSLNNPKLSAQGILEELKQVQSKNTVQRLNSFQVSLAKIYYDKNFNSNELDTKREDILTIITSPLFDEFPALQSVLQNVFSYKELPSLDTINSLAISETIGNAQNFATINQKYGYFNNADQLGNLTQLYQQLEPLCRKMSILVEKQAYDEEMAYKIMVLCYPNDTIDTIANKAMKLFKGRDKSVNSHYHDTFVTELSPFPKSDDVNNLPGWQKFILNNGFSALQFFKECQLFDDAPATIQAAKTTLLSKTYPRANENKNFAEFCKKYRITNNEFEAGLDFIATGWPKKTTDNIPEVDILITKTHNYRWVKLPTDDWRALYLGKMLPGCCQVINGHSAQCVKDGATLADNGFYVLLKTKPNEANADKLSGDVVAQSYAWISKNGNLCLDSIEWDGQRVTAEIINMLLQEFSTQVFASRPEIKYITVGTGGQTRRLYQSKAYLPEKIKQGIQYTDSREQYLIADRRKPTEIPQLYGLTSKERDTLLYLSAYIETLDENIDFIKNSRSSPELFENSIYQPFPSLLGKSLSLSDLETLTFAEYEQLPESEQAKISTFRKLLNSSTQEQVLRWLPTIPQTELLDIIKEEVWDGLTVLHLASVSPESLTIILSILTYEERIVAVKEKNNYGSNVLHLAAKYPKSLTSILSLLTDSGRVSVVKEKDRDGQTVVHLAARYPESLTTILSLLPELVRLNAVKETNNNGETVLHLVAANVIYLTMIISLLRKIDRIAAVNISARIIVTNLLSFVHQQKFALSACIAMILLKKLMEQVTSYFSNEPSGVNCSLH